MIRRTPRSTRTDTLFPYTTLFRSILGVVILHIWALHIPGSNNPTGVEVKGPQDTLPFHPYYTAKDGFGLGVFLIALALRSEEHTSELQSLMRISYAVFCLKKKTQPNYGQMKLTH